MKDEVGERGRYLIASRLVELLSPGKQRKRRLPCARLKTYLTLRAQKSAHTLLMAMPSYVSTCWRNDASNSNTDQHRLISISQIDWPYLMTTAVDMSNNIYGIRCRLMR